MRSYKDMLLIVLSFITCIVLFAGFVFIRSNTQYSSSRTNRSRTNPEFDSICSENRFFECQTTGSQTESKNRFIRFCPYRYTTLLTYIALLS